MNKEEKVIFETIKSGLMDINDNLNAYEKVEAELSIKTLIDVAHYIQEANKRLERGFVEDSCSAVEEDIYFN